MSATSYASAGKGAGRPLAVLFDLDGVLWDSSPAHEWAFIEVCLKENLSPLPYTQLAGRNTPDAWALVLAANNLEATPAVVEALTGTKQKLARHRLHEQCPLRPETSLVEDLSREGLLVGLVTGSSPATVKLFLEVSGLSFDIVVDGSAVAQGKPAPEPYLAASAALSLGPSQCWALEDSEQGLHSARSAGTRAAHLRPERSCDLDHAGVEACVGSIGEFVDLVLEVQR